MHMHTCSLTYTGCSSDCASCTPGPWCVQITKYMAALSTVSGSTPGTLRARTLTRSRSRVLGACSVKAVSLCQVRRCTTLAPVSASCRSAVEGETAGISIWLPTQVEVLIAAFSNLEGGQGAVSAVQNDSMGPP